jgi:hypothetical protein
MPACVIREEGQSNACVVAGVKTLSTDREPPDLRVRWPRGGNRFYPPVIQSYLPLRVSLQLRALSLVNGA